MNHFPRGLGAVVTLALCLVATAAAAGDKEAAKRHFENGIAMMEVEDFAGAAVEFEASVTAHPTKSALFNLGMCQKALHRYPLALATFRRLLSSFGGELDADMKAETQANLRAIGKLIAELEITVNVGGASVFIDGEKVGTAPFDQPVATGAGERRIRVEAAGYETEERTVSLEGGSRKPIAFDLKPGTAPVAPAPVVTSSAPPPPPPGAAAPPPPASATTPAAPPVAAPPPATLNEIPSEMGRVAKAGGIGVAVQTVGWIGVMSSYLSDYDGTMDIESAGAIYLAVTGAAGGTLAWLYATSSDFYDVNPFAPIGGGLVGAGVTYGLGYLWWYSVDFGDNYDYEVDWYYAALAFGIAPLLVPPLFEAIAIGIFRRPEERYKNATVAGEDVPGFRVAGGHLSILEPTAVRATDGSQRLSPGMTLGRFVF